MSIVKLYFFKKFTILEIIFISSFWTKDLKRICCAKARLLCSDRAEIKSDRSFRLQTFLKIGDLKTPAKFHKNTPVLESHFNKVALKFFIKNRPQGRCFAVNIARFLRAAFVNRNTCFWADSIIFLEWLISSSCFVMCYVISAYFYYKKFAATNKGIIKEKNKRKCFLMIFYFCSWKCVLHMLL